MRECALKVLYEVDKGAYLDVVLKSALANGVSDLDRRFLTELTYGVQSYRARLDHIIGYYSKIPFKKISPWIKNILRLGIYQILFLDKVPESAAVNESVKLAKRYGHGASANFTNGLLRSVIKGGDPTEPADLENFYSYPKWMVELWKDEYDDEFVKDLLKANNQKAPVTIRPNTLKISREELVEKLSGHEHGDMIEVNGMGNIEKRQEYQDGLFTVQDGASYQASKVLDPQSGELVLDLCAAPGGKTTHIAELMSNSGEIHAFDIHPHKIELIEKNAERLGINNIRARVQDAKEFMPEFECMADRVLVDAPCSGLGVLRRKPDIKWKKELKDIEVLADIQNRILQNAVRYLKKGGTLVYSTCTVSKKENHPVAGLEPLFEKQFFPHIDGTNGFYIFKGIKI